MVDKKINVLKKPALGLVAVLLSGWLIAQTTTLRGLVL